MAENGSFRERWQYRQEMKAHGAWNHWGFPTRDDYAQFHDARNLADLVKTWRPHNVEAYGLGEHGLAPLIQAEKEEAYALLDKRMESGLSEAEVRTYAQLVNRWQAEHAMLAGEEVQMPAQTPAEEASYQSWLAQRNTGEGQTQVRAHHEEHADELNELRLWRDQIETNTEFLKQELQGIGDAARAQASYIPQDGLTIGEKGNQLVTGGRGDWEAPKIHPVWAPEVAREADMVEQMGSATFEYEPQRRKLEEWEAAGKPNVHVDEDHYRPYEQTRAAVQEAVGEVLELQQAYPPQSAEHRDLQAEASELRETLQALDRTPVALPTDEARAWSREPDGVVIRDLRDRLDALMNPADMQTVRQRPEAITSRIADLVEEAQRQGWVVTGQETPQLPHQQRRGY